MEENTTSLTKQWRQQDTKVHPQINSKKLQNENNGHKMNTNKNKKVGKYFQASLAIPNMIKGKKTPCDYLKKLNKKESLDLELPWKIFKKIQNYKKKSSLLLSKCLEYV